MYAWSGYANQVAAQQFSCTSVGLQEKYRW